MAKALFLGLIIVLFPALSLAQNDSVSTAIDIVEDFHKDSNRLMTKANLTAPENLRKKAIGDLEGIRLTETPGPKRFDHVYGVVDGYTRAVMSHFETSATKVHGPAYEALRNGLRELRTMRESSLSGLKESQKFETPAEKRIKPVPSLDTPPYEKTPTEPDGAPGIWYR